MRASACRRLAIPESKPRKDFEFGIKIRPKVLDSGLTVAVPRLAIEYQAKTIPKTKRTAHNMTRKQYLVIPHHHSYPPPRHLVADGRRLSKVRAEQAFQGNTHKHRSLEHLKHSQYSELFYRAPVNLMLQLPPKNNNTKHYAHTVI